MKKSIKRRMWFAYTGFMILLIGIGVLLTFFFLRPYYLYQSKNKMRTLSREIIKEYQNFPEKFPEYIDDMDKAWNTSITVINPKYQILYTSLRREGKRNRVAKKTRFAIRENWDLLDKNDYCFYTNYYDKREDQKRLMYIEKMPDNNYMVLRQSVVSINNSLNFFVQFYLIAGFLLFMAGNLLIPVLAKKFSSPIEQMSAVAMKIANLDFTSRVEVNSNDELGMLADAMNHISEQMDKNIDELRHDIERRKNLVRNLSHELKSPVGVVKGYAEGLKYMVVRNPEKMERYCDVIVAECDRMNDLILKMLELSRMEATELTQSFTEVSSGKLSEYVRERYELTFREKQITYQEEIEEMEIPSVEILLRQILDNFISNALKFTPPQGKVCFLARASQGMAALSLYNSGSHIPEENLSDIFEVFYKVDRARSRKDEGYGIGLAIVKQIVDMHHGREEVKNTEDGVVFTVFLPLKPIER